MAEVTDVTIVAGLPTAGDGTVPTLSKTNTILGAKTDAKSTATDTTSASLIAISKQISASVQTLASALSTITNTTNALDINIKSGANANGSAVSANSAPVVIASDQGWPVGTTGFMKKEDVASADGDAGIPAMAIQKATPSDTGGTDGDYTMLQMKNGRLWVSPEDPYSQYETVAASQTAQALGATGATGDYLAGVLVFPGTAGCGVVTILDNATTIGTFAGGGTTALPSLVPFMIPVGLISVSGAWKITTGANVTAVGIGKFT